MKQSTLARTALAFSLLLAFGLVVAPAAVTAASHLDDSDDGSAQALPADFHQRMDATQSELNTMFQTQTTDSDAQASDRRALTAFSGKKAKKMKKAKKKKRRPVRGEITVCKLFLDENDSAIQGTSVPGVEFSTNVSGQSVDEQVSFETPLDLNGDLNANDINDSQCETHENLELGTYEYSEETITGDEDDRVSVVGYNDDWTSGEDDLGSLNDYTESATSDGEIELTRDNREQTLVIANRLAPEEEEEAEEVKQRKKVAPMKKKYMKKFVKKRQPVRGELEVCKLFLDENDSAIRGTSVPGVEFSSDITGPNTDNTFSATTPLDLSGDLNANDINDSECTTYTNLQLGTYEYSEEDITGNNSDRVSVVGYNDDWTYGTDDLSSLNNYTESATSDGEIELTRDDRDRTLVIVNRLAPEEAEEAEEVRKKRPKKKGKKGFFTMMRQAPTTTQPDTTTDTTENAEDEMAQEEELAEEELGDEFDDRVEDELSQEEDTDNDSTATVTQEANQNIEQTGSAEASGNNSEATVDQLANQNIEQDAEAFAE